VIALSHVGIGPAPPMKPRSMSGWDTCNIKFTSGPSVITPVGFDNQVRSSRFANNWRTTPRLQVFSPSVDLVG